MRNLSVAKKIWLSMGVLIFGYCTSIGLGFILNRFADRGIHLVKDAVYPTVRTSERLVDSFDAVEGLLERAVLTGDEDVLLDSEESLRRMIPRLEPLARDAALPHASRDLARTLSTDLEDFRNEAMFAYRDLIRAGDSPSGPVQERVSGLAEQRRQLRSQIDALRDKSLGLFRDELDGIRRYSSLQGQVHLMVFLVAMCLSVPLVSLIINRFTLAPIQRLLVAMRSGETLEAASLPKDEIGELAVGFKDLLGRQQAMTDELQNEILARTLVEDDLRKHKDHLEEMVESRTQQLRSSHRALTEEKERIQLYLDLIGTMLVAIGADRNVTMINRKGCEVLGYAEADVVGKDWFDNFLSEESKEEVVGVFDQLVRGEGEMPTRYENDVLTRDGRRRRVFWHNAVVRDAQGAFVCTVSSGSDVTEQQQLESELRQAQKLESVGQLAAGIAHEINTPIQFVGDNIRFMQDSIGDLMGLAEQHAAVIDELKRAPLSDERREEMATSLADADLPYLAEELPNAVEQSLEGVDRVAKIVRAMKAFSHPGSTEMVSANINEAIQTTATVARNEWKYVADMDLDLDDSLPMVPCLIGELNQVVLNMIVNARDAIAEKNGAESTAKGSIRIATKREDGRAVITVRDTGAGIPEHVRVRIFDPFFTTKDVGKGSGQGLAIARNVIVDKHRGKLDVESEPGKGTTFVIHLPLNPPGKEGEDDGEP